MGPPGIERGLSRKSLNEEGGGVSRPLPRLSRKLSAVARRTRRRSKALVERDAPSSCLTFSDYHHVSGQGHIKDRNVALSPFGLSGRLDGLQRAESHSKCW